MLQSSDHEPSSPNSLSAPLVLSADAGGHAKQNDSSTPRSICGTSDHPPITSLVTAPYVTGDAKSRWRVGVSPLSNLGGGRELRSKHLLSARARLAQSTVSQ